MSNYTGIGKPRYIKEVFQKRFSSGKPKDRKRELSENNRRIVLYCVSVVIATVGLGYAAVPLYKVFCQVTGYGGETQRKKITTLDKVTPVQGVKQVTITFDGMASQGMAWSFRPIQRQVKVVPGETSLAFYRAKNTTDKPVVGVATYNVVPTKCGVYFNKIQCFCFEEQRLQANEEVDMPVFFFIDPDFANDPNMKDVTDIVLSYTFWKSNVTNELGFEE